MRCHDLGVYRQPGKERTSATLQDILAIFTGHVGHGLFEVIERDCVNVHWYSRLPPPRVDVDLHDILPTHFRAHRVRMSTPYIPEVQVFLTTLDAPIPVLTAIAVDQSRQERAFLGGSG